MPTTSQAGIRASNFALAVLWVCLPVCLPLRAQRAERAQRSTVSGHVVCADTNAPARLAKVTLNALSDQGKNPMDTEAAPGTTTDMDGAFSIPEVATGRYLVLVELAGYVSGVSGLDTEARGHLRDTARRPPPGSTVIEVANGLPVTVDVTIERGGSVSGSIRYDDGSPAIGILVGLERKNSKGAWEPALQSTLQTFSFFSQTHDGSEATDSAGRFQVDGMPAGEYILHAHLSPQTVTLPISGNGTFGVYNHPGVDLDLYSGGVFWRKEAKAITLGSGEDVDADLEVPLSKLTTVSGYVVAAADGHSVNLGTVTLSPQDDPEETRSTEIEEDGRFRFLYVPEGDYVLKTTDAVDGETAAMQGHPSALQVNIHHLYGKAETVLHVGEDAAIVTLTVPERDAQPAQ
jgi:Carboxypeptidase regulatory-like domain